MGCNIIVNAPGLFQRILQPFRQPPRQLPHIGRKADMGQLFPQVLLIFRGVDRLHLLRLHFHIVHPVYIRIFHPEIMILLHILPETDGPLRAVRRSRLIGFGGHGKDADIPKLGAFCRNGDMYRYRPLLEAFFFYAQGCPDLKTVLCLPFLSDLPDYIQKRLLFPRHRGLCVLPQAPFLRWTFRLSRKEFRRILCGFCPDTFRGSLCGFCPNPSRGSLFGFCPNPSRGILQGLR